MAVGASINKIQGPLTWTREEPSSMRFTLQVRVVVAWAILQVTFQMAQVDLKVTRINSFKTNTNLPLTMAKRTTPTAVAIRWTCLQITLSSWITSTSTVAPPRSLPQQVASTSTQLKVRLSKCVQVVLSLWLPMLQPPNQQIKEDPSDLRVKLRVIIYPREPLTASLHHTRARNAWRSTNSNNSSSKLRQIKLFLKWIPWMQTQDSNL